VRDDSGDEEHDDYIPSDSTIAEGHTPPSMTAVSQGTVRRMTQFPVPLLRTNVKSARSKRVRVPL
jgi:hypothetical protein